MGLFPYDGNNVSGVVIHGNDYEPSLDGAVIYLNGGNDLQPILTKAEANKGKVLVPKTEIGPEMGFYVIFIDTEGDKLGVLSEN